MQRLIPYHRLGFAVGFALIMQKDINNEGKSFEATGKNRMRLLAERDVRPDAAAAVVAAGGRLLKMLLPLSCTLTTPTLIMAIR